VNDDDGGFRPDWVSGETENLTKRLVNLRKWMSGFAQHGARGDQVQFDLIRAEQAKLLELAGDLQRKLSAQALAQRELLRAVGQLANRSPSPWYVSYVGIAELTGFSHSYVRELITADREKRRPAALDQERPEDALVRAKFDSDGPA
jgi:hypothetical protein